MSSQVTNNGLNLNLVLGGLIDSRRESRVVDLAHVSGKTKQD